MGRDRNRTATSIYTQGMTSERAFSRPCIAITISPAEHMVCWIIAQCVYVIPIICVQPVNSVPML